MSFFYIILAFFVAFTQRSFASYEHGHGFGAIPVGVIQQPVMTAPVVHAHVMPAPVVQPIVAAPPPVIAAPPPVIAAPAPVPVPVPVPYVHEHHHAPAEIHNRFGEYHKEAGHLSKTSVFTPYKSKKITA